MVYWIFAPVTKDILGDQSRQSPKSWEDQSADGTKELGGQKVQETI